jgi:RNA polymerase-binding transcription factor DksA
MAGTLTPQQLVRLRNQLEAERDALATRIAAREQEVQENVQEESGVDDQGDDASLLFDRESDIDANVDDRDQLARVEAALRRMDEGTYGLSEVSGKPIPIERLEAVPSATTLVEEVPAEE